MFYSATTGPEVNPIRLHCRGPLYIVTIDRPPVNAIDQATSRRLTEIFDQFAQDDSARVAILTGAGEKFFSAGWDLKAASRGEEENADYGQHGFGGVTRNWVLDKPVIAAVNGAALGGGFEIVLACDIILASETATFGLPEAKIGIAAGSGGVIRLPRRVGRSLANEMMMTGCSIDAARAKQHGLTDHVVPCPDLLDRAEAIALQIANAAPLAVRSIKSAIAETEHMSERAAFEHLDTGALPIFHKLLQTEDAREGIRAFTEKRAPIWKGR
jgi:crotonobetainyl-CoA hydratase